MLKTPHCGLPHAPPQAMTWVLPVRKLHPCDFRLQLQLCNFKLAPFPSILCYLNYSIRSGSPSIFIDNQSHCVHSTRKTATTMAAATSRKELLSKVQKMVPPMLESFHKGELVPSPSLTPTLTSFQGQLGRVAVIGGSEDYTGAPYFSAMASAKLGADMVRRHTVPLSSIIWNQIY